MKKIFLLSVCLGFSFSTFCSEKKEVAKLGGMPEINHGVSASRGVSAGFERCIQRQQVEIAEDPDFEERRDPSCGDFFQAFCRPRVWYCGILSCLGTCGAMSFVLGGIGSVFGRMVGDSLRMGDLTTRIYEQASGKRENLPEYCAQLVEKYSLWKLH